MIRGNLTGLSKIASRIGKMATPAWREGLSRVAAEAARERVAVSFAEERDPWGRPWKKSLRSVLEGGQTLSDTGRLRRSFTYNASANGFVIGTNVLYAATHQYGATIRAKRGPYLKFRLAGGSRKRKGGRGRWVQVPSVNIPARPFIPEPELSPSWKAALESAIKGYMDANKRSF